jgi:hypothetical protein
MTARQTLLCLLVLSSLGYVFNLWKMPEPAQTVFQSIFWISIMVGSALGLRYAKLE